jgi:hypothetical protein
MTRRELEEYKALRGTIRERGTTRIWLFLIGLVAWASLAVATAALAALPVAALLPLLVLDGVFETVYSVQLGIERIGRYIQIFFETEDETAGSGGPRRWEHTAMAFGRAFPSRGTDPLFSWLFGAAAVLNFVPVMLAEPVALEIVLVGAAHLLFLLRIVVARRAATQQRAKDLERFQSLRQGRE